MQHSPGGRMWKVRDFFIAAGAVVIGDVEVGADTSFWPFACVRGDVAAIRIGSRCSIQDFAMLHCKHLVPLVLEDDVIVGHHACVHGGRVGARTLIGIHAAVLDESEIGPDCIVAAGAIVVPGTVVPAGKVVAGTPAKILRDVRDADRAYIRAVGARYVDLSRAHVQGKFPPIAGGVD